MVPLSWSVIVSVLLLMCPVLAAPPTIDTEPTAAVVAVGSNVTFTVTATGTEPLAYQWYFNTNSLLTGETASSLMLVDVQPPQTGWYSVVVTNAEGSVTSRVARLTVEWRAELELVSGWPNDGLKSNAATWADYDGDGLLDLYIASEQQNRLYRNEGDGSFVVKVTSVLMENVSECVGSAWADWDNDGDLDVCTIGFGGWAPSGIGGMNNLYINQGLGVFEKVSFSLVEWCATDQIVVI